MVKEYMGGDGKRKSESEATCLFFILPVVPYAHVIFVSFP